MSEIPPNIEQTVGRRAGWAMGQARVHLCTACMPAQIKSNSEPKQELLEPKIPMWAPRGGYHDLILD